jgi:hypothetical protein
MEWVLSRLPPSKNNVDVEIIMFCNITNEKPCRKMELHDDESRARLPREAGAFEVCFASGLDLSELLEPTKNVV